MVCSVTNKKSLKLLTLMTKLAQKNLKRKEPHFSNTVEAILATTIVSDQL